MAVYNHGYDTKLDLSTKLFYEDSDMAITINEVLAKCLNHQQTNQIYFANYAQSAPLLADQVSLPRIEIMIEGKQSIQWADYQGNIIEKTLFPSDLLYITAQSWSKPAYTTPFTTLSILYDKQQISISINQWDGQALTPYDQINVPRRGARIGAFIIQALAELTWQHQPCERAPTAYHLIQSLLSHTFDLLNVDVETSTKTASLFEAIRLYIDSHFRDDITRDFLAKMFYISPNYLSHLFQREGKIGLNEYLTHVRLEYAKTRLRDYDLNIKDIALASGFKDSHYFCRIFRKKTERTPTEYRRQYHSQLIPMTDNNKPS